MTTTTASVSFDLTEDHLGRLTLRRLGMDDAVDVRLRRAFPWSLPGQFVSIRSSDGKELELIDDVAELPESQCAIVEEWLAGNNFIPKITRVHAVDVRFGYQLWKVETDRGPAEFRVQEREDIRFLQDGRFNLKDADGNVYELAGLHQLDDASRRAVEALL